MVTALQRQVAGLFVVEDRGNHEIKGVPEPVTLFRLVRGERWWPPCWAASCDAACGARRGNRHADAALGASAAGRGAVGSHRWGAGSRQISSD